MLPSCKEKFVKQFTELKSKVRPADGVDLTRRPHISRPKLARRAQLRLQPPAAMPVCCEGLSSGKTLPSDVRCSYFLMLKNLRMTVTQLGADKQFSCPRHAEYEYLAVAAMQSRRHGVPHP